MISFKNEEIDLTLTDKIKDFSNLKIDTVQNMLIERGHGNSKIQFFIEKYPEIPKRETLIRVDDLTIISKSGIYTLIFVTKKDCDQFFKSYENILDVEEEKRQEKIKEMQQQLEPPGTNFWDRKN